MASLLSQEFTTQRDGSRHVVERYLDDAGHEHLRTYWADSKMDIEQRVQDYIPVLEAQIAQQAIDAKQQSDRQSAEFKALEFVKAQPDVNLKAIMTDDEIAALKNG